MTDDPKGQELLRDLEKIERYVPEIPRTYERLRSLIASLPPPTAPDIHTARQGQAPDSGLQVSSFGQPAANSPLSGQGIGENSGPGGLLPQLFYGKSNLLPDSAFTRVGLIDPITNAFTNAGFYGAWEVEYILNSGTLPAFRRLTGEADTLQDVDNPLSTAACEIELTNFAAGASDTTILLRSRQVFDALAGSTYLIGSVRVGKLTFFPNNFTNVTSIVMTMELYDNTTGLVVATSTPFDYKAFYNANGFGAMTRLTAPGLTANLPNAVRWQLRVRVVTTGAGGDVALLLGEPQMVLSTIELAPPYSPIIGAWIPDTLLNRGFTSDEAVNIGVISDASSNSRASIFSSGNMEWGSGAAAHDLRLQRSAASVLRLDDVVGGRASLEGAAGTGPGSPAAGFGRLYYSSATKSWHQVDDAGVDKDLAILAADVTQVSRAAAAAAADYVARIRLTTDTTYRAFLGLDASDRGELELGPGGVAARDLRLYRSGAKAATLDDTAGGNATLNVIGTLQQSGTGVSVIGHGAADHADVTRSFLLLPEDCTLDAATLINVGASPNLTRAINYADAATQGAFWTFEVPTDFASTLNVRPLWSPGATDAVAHTVRWSITVKILATGSDVTAAGVTTAFTGTSAARTVNILVTEAAQASGAAPAAGDRMKIELQRIGADAADTYVGAVRLLGLFVEYTANQ